jgi:peptide/nickel transport system permease protein
MGKYIAQRLLLSIPVLFGVSILIFGGVRVVPGDICAIVLQIPDYAPDKCESLRQDLGLDEPVVTQYADWMTNILTGDFGTSIISQRSVATEIQKRSYTTIELAFIGTMAAIVIAVPIGVYGALKQDKLPDVLGRVVTIGWLSMPSFWIGTMLITFPAKWWGYSPPVGYVQIWDDPLKNLEQVYLPALSLSLALSASLARLTRSSMLEVLRQDYVRTARAKGLQERTVMTKHALKNAMLPVVTLLGLQIGFLLGGTVVLESLFSLPGLGTLLLNSVTYKDFPMLQALVLFFAMIIILINLAVDISYALFDPRVRFS